MTRGPEEAKGWLSRKSISVDFNEVAADLQDFPVLVYLNADADLAAAAQTSGNDIRFVDSSGQLAHEIEKYDSTTGELVAWVKIPSVSSFVPSVFEMQYENPGAANQRNAREVWTNDYAAVYHLHDNLDDSTYANHDGSNNGSADTSGAIADGQLFVPTDEIDVGTWNVSGQDLTIQAWINVNGFGQDDPRFISQAGGTNTEDHVFMLGLTDPGERRLRFRLKTGTVNSAGTTTLVESSDSVQSGQWHLVAATYDSADMRILNDGVETATLPKTGDIRTNS